MRVLVTPAVYPRVFEIFTSLTFGALLENHIVSPTFEDTTKKNNETLLFMSGQQCIMKCQEHNRSEKGTLREKNQDPTSMTVPQEKDDICNRLQTTPHGIYLHYVLN